MEQISKDGLASLFRSSNWQYFEAILEQEKNSILSKIMNEEKNRELNIGRYKELLQIQEYVQSIVDLSTAKSSTSMTRGIEMDYTAPEGLFES